MSISAKNIASKGNQFSPNHQTEPITDVLLEHKKNTIGSSSNTHVTVLGEQEILNAVEAAAVVFKKVVLQRRKEKLAAEEEVSSMDVIEPGEYFCEVESKFKINGNEFKLVFLNSDCSSSSIEDEDETYADSWSSYSSCSSAGHSSSVLSSFEDGDWDYFEPSMSGISVTSHSSLRDDRHSKIGSNKLSSYQLQHNHQMGTNAQFEPDFIEEQKFETCIASKFFDPCCSTLVTLAKKCICGGLVNNQIKREHFNASHDWKREQELLTMSGNNFNEKDATIYFSTDPMESKIHISHQREDQNAVKFFVPESGINAALSVQTCSPTGLSLDFLFSDLSSESTFECLMCKQQLSGLIREAEKSQHVVDILSAKKNDYFSFSDKTTPSINSVFTHDNKNNKKIDAHRHAVDKYKTDYNGFCLLKNKEKNSTKPTQLMSITAEKQIEKQTNELVKQIGGKTKINSPTSQTNEFSNLNINSRNVFTPAGKTSLNTKISKICQSYCACCNNDKQKKNSSVIFAVSVTNTKEKIETAKNINFAVEKNCGTCMASLQKNIKSKCKNIKKGPVENIKIIPNKVANNHVKKEVDQYHKKLTMSEKQINQCNKHNKNNLFLTDIIVESSNNLLNENSGSIASDTSTTSNTTDSDGTNSKENRKKKRRTMQCSYNINNSSMESINQPILHLDIELPTISTHSDSLRKVKNEYVQRPKRRRFAKVYEVNHSYEPRLHLSHSSSTENDSASSDANLEDSSDNDTDTERTDCGVVLNYIKNISDSESEERERFDRRVSNVMPNDKNSAVSLNAIRSLTEEEIDRPENQTKSDLFSVDAFTTDTFNVEVTKEQENDVDYTNKSKQLNDQKNTDIESANEEEEHCSHIPILLPLDTIFHDCEINNTNYISTQDTCDKLHTISNDVNRMLLLNKPNLQTEMKLQKLKKDVAEINEDHLKFTLKKDRKRDSTERLPKHYLSKERKAFLSNEIINREQLHQYSAEEEVNYVHNNNDEHKCKEKTGKKIVNSIAKQVNSKRQNDKVVEKKEHQQNAAGQAKQVTESNEACNILVDSLALNETTQVHITPVKEKVDIAKTTHIIPKTKRISEVLKLLDDIEIKTLSPGAERTITKLIETSSSSDSFVKIESHESDAIELLNDMDIATRAEQGGVIDSFSSLPNSITYANRNNSNNACVCNNECDSNCNKIIDCQVLSKNNNKFHNIAFAPVSLNSLSPKYRSLITITKENNEEIYNSSINTAAVDKDNVSENLKKVSCGIPNTAVKTFTLDSLMDEKKPTLDNDVFDHTSEYESLNENARHINKVGDNNANEKLLCADKSVTKTPDICLEDGLADDDSWVEELSQHEDDLTDDTPDSDGLSDGIFVTREDDLRGYNRSAIDFTLHTIVEESCEDSEIASLRTDNEDSTHRRQHNRLSASELEKYFFFGLGDGKTMSSIDTRGEIDTASEVSSDCSDCFDTFVPDDSSFDLKNVNNLASSRLEKYFLSGFMGFNATEKNDIDESDSVGSDSEGRNPSPSHRRKRVKRARGTPRSHNSSLDNLLMDSNTSMSNESLNHNVFGEQFDTSESEACDTAVNATSVTERVTDGSTTEIIKRKKQVRKRHDSLDEKNNIDIDSFDDATNIHKHPSMLLECTLSHHNRESDSNDNLHHKNIEIEPGFIDNFVCTTIQNKSPNRLQKLIEDKKMSKLSIVDKSSLSFSTLKVDSKVPSISRKLNETNIIQTTQNIVKNTNLVRKDSFNNWSSDEETNLMMSKMRHFFKTLIVATANAQQSQSCNVNSSSKSTTPKQTPVPMRRIKSQPAQLAYFENELTRLMKAVPGINDEQVREIVEYLSSEDAWSDSCDSSDYTSSDLESNTGRKVDLKAQISESCQQIINKYEVDEEGDRGDGGLIDETHGLNCDTALVYQKLVASFSQIALGNKNISKPKNQTLLNEVPVEPSDNRLSKQPAGNDQIIYDKSHNHESSQQLFTKVMQHIGTKLVALMHEVSSGNDTHATNSPKHSQRSLHKRLHAKISATTTEDEEDEREMENEFMHYPRIYQQVHSVHKQVYNHQINARPQPEQEKVECSSSLARSKSHDILLDSVSTCNTSGNGSSNVYIGVNCTNCSQSQRPCHYHSSSGVSDSTVEESGMASDYERFSWRGSFESALLANGDSRTKLSQLDRDNSSSASALAIAKRRSAGDLLFNHKSLSREQLDRVRSCGSIGGGDEQHHQLEASPSKPWLSSSDSKDERRSSVPDAIYESDSSNDGNSRIFSGIRSTLPRSLIGSNQVAITNSLPRLPTTSASAASAIGEPTTISTMLTSTPVTKSQSAINYNAVSARYRSPGYGARSIPCSKKSGSNLGLQHALYMKREAKKRLNMSSEEAKVTTEESNRSPTIGRPHDSISSPKQSSNDTWPVQQDEDIDRLVAMHQNRSSLSSLGVRSESMASVYSAEGRYGSVQVKGQVEFAMQYNYKLEALEIHIVRCKDLAAVDTKRSRSDPYVKVYLLPDKSKAGKRKTKVKKHTLNPIFDEIIRFHTPVSSLESRTLWITVWHSDMFGRNDFLGEVSVNLQGRMFDNPQSQWYLLQERSEPFEETATYRGDIVVGLKFVPPETIKISSATTLTGSSSNLRKFGSIKGVSSKSERIGKGGQLHVLIKEAKHLSPIKANGMCDAFCKSYLLPDRTRSSKQKTPILKRSVNPTWNYTFIYDDVSLEELSERALELTVWDHDRLASNEFVGGVRFSLGTGKSYGRQVEWMDATGKELSLWQNMIERPNFWVEGSLSLRSNFDITCKSNTIN